jgi:hypothetical protein
MAVTQIADIVIPAQFTAYVIENSVVSTALFLSGVAVENAEIASQLHAGAENFTIPFWRDLGETDANISTDNPTDIATPLKITAGAQVVRKSFLNQSWSTADLAAELSGDNPLERLQSRVTAYWDRTWERRLVATLNGVMASNVANNGGDMVYDVSGQAGNAALFNATAVINTAATLGDRINDVKAVAMHSHIYTQALINDEIQFIPNSQGEPIKTYRGMAVIIDDNLSPANGVYTTVLLGSGAVGYGASAPRVAPGTEIYRYPSQGNGGGVTQFYTRMNMSIHSLGFTFTNASVASDSPSTAELAVAGNWARVAASRKSIPLAFLTSK